MVERALPTASARAACVGAATAATPKGKVPGARIVTTTATAKHALAVIPKKIGSASWRLAKNPTAADARRTAGARAACVGAATAAMPKGKVPGAKIAIVTATATRALAVIPN